MSEPTKEYRYDRDTEPEGKPLPPEDPKQSTILTSNDLTEFIPAMVKARLEIPEFATDTTGQTGHQQYRYAPLPLVLKNAVPALGKHGLLIVQAPLVLGRTVHLDTKIYHTSGQWIGCELSCAVDSSVGGAGGEAKAIGSAISYLRRYALLPLLGVAADRDDDGGAAGGNGKSSTATHGGQDPRRSRPKGRATTAKNAGAASTRDESRLTDVGKKILVDMGAELETYSAGDEQRSRAIVQRITRFKPAGKTEWFPGHLKLDQIKSDRMARMARHNLGELVNGSIALDDPMD